MGKHILRPNDHDNEDSLRAFLKDRPNNAKGMCKLSSLLWRKYNESKSEECLEESLCLARRAVLMRPQKIFTHATLSQVAIEYEERMRGLENTVHTIEKINNSEGKGPNKSLEEKDFIYAVSLARLLVEPRERLRDGWLNKKKMGKGFDKKNPIRKDLNEKEKVLYDRTKLALENVWRSLDHSSSKDQPSSDLNAQIQHLALTEYRLGVFFRKMEPEEEHRGSSRQHFLKVINSLEKKNKLAKKSCFWIATLSKEFASEISSYVPEFDRCPEDYIVSLYATFASNFDHLLVNKLDYQTPTILRNKLNFKFPGMDNSEKRPRGLDLGCGTGLSGVAFRDCVNYLEGVDLSPEMVDKAEQRGCYDKLSVNELERNLFQQTKQFDLVIACDVFVYIGDLDSVFAAVRKVISTSGIFAFSTELLDATHEKGFILQPTARFAHTMNYLEDLCTRHEYTILSADIETIRRNKGKDIKGVLAILTMTTT